MMFREYFKQEIGRDSMAIFKRSYVRKQMESANDVQTIKYAIVGLEKKYSGRATLC